ncbi:hypothetical protein PFISCL1PPCAC_13405, partial [Pristionchus fissidentatus]
IESGVCGILSVIGYVMCMRYPIREEFSWIFRAGYVCNAFSVTAATIAKFYMVLHRFVVMRSGTAVEEVWSTRMSLLLIAILLILSIAKCVPLLFCSYNRVTVNQVVLITYFDNACVSMDKNITSAMYFTYSIATIVLTVLTSRELYKLSRNAEVGT